MIQPNTIPEATAPRVPGRLPRTLDAPEREARHVGAKKFVARSRIRETLRVDADGRRPLDDEDERPRIWRNRRSMRSTERQRKFRPPRAHYPFTVATICNAPARWDESLYTFLALPLWFGRMRGRKGLTGEDLRGRLREGRRDIPSAAAQDAHIGHFRASPADASERVCRSPQHVCQTWARA